MKNILMVTFVAIVVTTGILLAQINVTTSIENRWKNVEKLAQKELPESALKEVEVILKQAQKEKNSVQLIKAMLYKMRFTLDKNPDEAPQLIKEFESFTEKSTDPVERAFLHSMTAELYAKYYQADAWKINQRTEIKGFIPEDIKEWTKNIYFDKITQHLKASIENPSILQQTNALKFSELMEKGNDSEQLQPMLFDFLGNRRIQILQTIKQAADIKNSMSSELFFAPIVDFVNIKLDSLYQKSIENQIIETYQQLLSFQVKGKNKASLIYTDLQRLKYVKDNVTIENTDSLFLNSITFLENQYSDNEAIVELLYEKANYFLNHTEQSNNKKIAYEICAAGIQKFPNYRRINLLKNIQKSILQKNIQMNYKDFSSPNTNLKINVKSTNVKSLQMKVYKVNATANEYFIFKQNRKERKEVYQNRQLIETREIKIQPSSNFGNIETEINLKTLDYGIYNFILTEIENLNIESLQGEFTVTDFAFIDRTDNPKYSKLYVLNRQTGQPQSKVNISAYTYKWSVNGYKMQIDSTSIYGRTNKNGMFEFPYSVNSNYKVFFFKRANDQYFSFTSGQNYFEQRSYENKNVKVSIFTDRSTYRPGQTIYFKGIAYYSNKEKQKVVSGKKLEVELYNTNGQKTGNIKVTSNEYGSFTGQFVLPEGGLNGSYRIQAGGNSQNIWVEEYKRPTFEVTIEKPKTEVNFGDQITLIGNVRAYSGYFIANAKVNYRVVRRPNRYCWWMYNEPETQIKSGVTNSDKDGLFAIQFIPEKTNNKRINGGEQFFNYSITADVTDIKGETQQGKQTVSVGEKSILLTAEINESLNLNEKQNIPINTINLNGEELNTKVTYSLYKLESSDIYSEKLEESTPFKVVEKMLDGTFDSKDKILKLSLNQFASGRYKFIFQAKDSHNHDVKFEKTVVLFNPKDKKTPVKCYEWLNAPKTECSVGESTQIQFGTSTKNSFVLYEIKRGNTVFESRWIQFSDEIKTFIVPFLSVYGNKITVSFTFLKDEQLFSKTVNINRKIEQKKLSPNLSVFRNKLLPGENATWTVSIPECKDKKAAELLVAMYDASLDAIRSHNWNFNPVYQTSYIYSQPWSVNGLSQNSDNASSSESFESLNELQFNQLNWFGLNFLNSNRTFRIRGAARTMVENDEISVYGQKSIRKVDMTGSIASLNEVVVAQENGILTKDRIMKIEEAEAQPKVQIRSNFNETAFFYPQLITDSAGNVKFTFTAPESLTRWNVKMLAHTKDLFFGQGEAQVVTQKDMMVQMNLPRFVRRSDQLVLSANVINLTDNELKTNVTFELIDPATEKPIKLKDAVVKDITLKANETKAVEWQVSEFSPFELVICKVVAQSDKFSDGEQKYLPVLPDKVLVTESMPMTIRGNETRTFTFESLLKNGSKVDTKNLSIEFSSNPSWYAVQALPSLSTPENENALDYFTAYYANSLAAFIANSNPKIAKVFDQWKNAKGSRDALISNLQKNAELKNMLLDETPWVMAAKDETEQKQRIALLFDLNMQKNQAQQYFDKLIKLQTINGGFSWFVGMPESRYITQEIILNLGRLNKIVGGNLLTTYSLPLNFALTYLDLEIARDFDQLKKNNKNYLNENCISNMQLFYLHLRSEFTEIPIHVSAQEAVKFYSDQSEKYWTNFTLYGKAMTALVAFRNGKIQIANEILKSLKENALKKDEFGMYWAKNTAGYFWNERPIAVQAAIIEAFDEISRDQKDIDEMKIWLLKQKQTQRWDSPLSTVNAIYALLYRGSDWLANDGSVSIKVGNTMLQPSNTEAGTGYFKESIPALDVLPEMGKVTVATSNKGIGWGAIYWQYYQDMDKIQGQSGTLKVSKKLIVVQGTNMIPIEQTELKKGDKVITRLVISTDRNLEFVALKDLRAACFEPINQRSGSVWKENVCYYQTTKDASTQFFFSYLPKGTYVFEYEMWVNNSGTFNSGIASIQCQYAPEFVSHTGGEKIKIVQ